MVFVCLLLTQAEEPYTAKSAVNKRLGGIFRITWRHLSGTRVRAQNTPRLSIHRGRVRPALASHHGKNQKPCATRR